MEQGGESESRSGRRVFMSYASADRPRVERLVSALAARGYSVWWDRDISGGAAYARIIEQALKDCDVVIVAWSRASTESDWVRDEAAHGRDHSRLVPLQLDDAEPPLGFRQYQVVRFAGWDGAPGSPPMQQLLAALETPAPGPRPTPAAAPPPLTAIGPLRRRGLLIGSAALGPALAAGAWWLRQRELSGPPAHSIAVLPFANLSGDAAQDYFSDGLSDELINALARLKPLQVVARTSAFKFKGSKAGSREIGARLGVAHILDGSVRREGALVRVATQLVEARTGFEAWSQTFDRDIKDILAVQSEIAQSVAAALKIHLLGADIATFALGGAASAEAYDDYLRGKRLFDAGGAEADYHQALALFDAAIAADAGYAAAHAARARTLLTLANQFTAPDRLRATYDEALASARQAVSLAPALADAQATLAAVLESGALDFAAAKQAYGRAMATGPGNADILTRFGQFSCEIGDFAPGLAAVRRAAVLDPLNPRVFRSLGYALVSARQFAEAITAMRRALELSPGAEGAHAAIGDALLLQGALPAARSEYALEPLAWLRLTGQAIVLRRLGDTPGAQAALAALQAQPDSVTLYQQAQVFAQWRDPDRALAALDQAYRSGDSGILLMKSDPLMDPLRADPRFTRLIDRLGLGR